MKKISASLLIAAAMSAGSLSLGGLAFANNTQAFTTTVETKPISVKINVSIGEDLAYRADHVSKDIRDRSRARSLNNGFAGRGFYGQRDLDRLADRLSRRMEHYLTKKGVEVSDDATTVLNLVITDADPNRPTFEQMGRNASLSFQSIALGGATFEGSLSSGDQDLGALSYAWYESNIRDVVGGATWHDANRAIDRFARHTAKALKQ